MNLSFVCFLLMYFAFSMIYGNGDSVLTCFNDIEKCQPEECCIQLRNTTIGKCRENLDVDKPCELNPMKRVDKDVYKVMCPCKTGLVCVGKKGIIGKEVGKCQFADLGEY